MVQKFLPNYRKWFDYEREQGQESLLFSLYVKPWVNPGVFYLDKERISWVQIKIY